MSEDQPTDINKDAEYCRGGWCPVAADPTKLRSTFLRSNYVVEVCEGELLLGYAIRFSGGWDVYRMSRVNLNLLRVATNVKRLDKALAKLGVDRSEEKS